MSDNDEFERHMHDNFGMTPQELAVLTRIAEGLHSDLRNALVGTSVADDVDGLLMLCRLNKAHQVKLAFYIREGLLPELAVQLMASGELEALLAE